MTPPFFQKSREGGKDSAGRYAGQPTRRFWTCRRQPGSNRL